MMGSDEIFLKPKDYTVFYYHKKEDYSKNEQTAMAKPERTPLAQGFKEMTHEDLDAIAGINDVNTSAVVAEIIALRTYHTKTEQGKQETIRAFNACRRWC
ncbi:hypothetical protein HY484_00460 [Candidatus Woesearchaeota archaeon]|nr:hypothetical protein [Candidatus Woesearchaeota archaeon]